MNCSASSEKFDEYIDGELSRADAAAVSEHVDRCARCRAQLESLRALRDAAAALPREIAPARDLWPAIESGIEQPDSTPERLSPLAAGGEETTARTTRHGTAGTSRSAAAAASRATLRWFVPLALAASLALLVNVAERRAAEHMRKPAWAVASVAGTPRVNTAPIAGSGQLRIGQWLETDAASRAKITVGSIGEVSLEPNSRLRLVDASPTDHRLELARGALSAFIWAPPRLFFVNTPSATAVDLGCAYTLEVNDEGGGVLQVSSGYVALEHGGRESIVPAGWMCLTRPGIGPGTPFLADAPAPLRRRLEQFDFEPGARGAALEGVLAEVRPEDGITLWHLLGRSEAGQRGAIFDVLTQHHAPPAGVTRAGIIAGDPDMRRAWGAEMGLASIASP